MNSQREAFEKACQSRFPNLSLKRYDSDLVARDFGREDGDYCTPMARDLWAGYQWGWQAATDQVREKSPLQQDGVPSFYISTRGYPCCTHRLHESDIAAWCKTAEQASNAMDAISDIQLSTSNPTKPTGGGVPEGWNFERVEKSTAYPNSIRVDSPGDHHCIIDGSTSWPEHHPIKMLYRLAAALLATQQPKD